MEDSTPPAPPNLDLSPRPPANHNKPRITGRAEAEAAVRIFHGPNCAGGPLASLSAAELRNDGITVEVGDDTTTRFSAVATDEAGNVSKCSRPAVYVEDSTPPQTAIKAGPKRKIRSKKNKVLVRFRVRANEKGSSFQCRLDRKPFRRCKANFKARVRVGRHRFQVRAIDKAGNVDPTPAKRAFRVIKTKRKR